MKRLKKEVGDADEVKVKRRLDENLQGRVQGREVEGGGK